MQYLKGAGELGRIERFPVKVGPGTAGSAGQHLIH